MKRTARIATVLASTLLALGDVAHAQGGRVEDLLISAPPPAPAPVPAPAPAAPSAPTPGQQAAESAASGQSRRDKAFQEALKQINPLSPGQIQEYRRQDAATKRALAAPAIPGRPVSRAVRVTLRPGEIPPSVRLQPGMVSTLTFSDLTGKPWPVLSVVVGNPSAYVAQSAGEEGKTNIIVISAIQEHVPSNLAVTLVGHPVPILMSIEQNQPETDFRVDVRVEARGPNAAQDIVSVSSLAPTNDSTMIQFLDGQPPVGSKRLQTSSGDVEAWTFDNQFYVRTRGDLLSPSYTARSNNVAGVNVYVLNDAPVLLVSQGGRMSSVHIRR